jgi:hypothetical protein
MVPLLAHLGACLLCLWAAVTFVLGEALLLSANVFWWVQNQGNAFKHG